MLEKIKRKRGRPVSSNTKDCEIKTRVNKDKLHESLQCAKLENMTLSAYLRSAIDLRNNLVRAKHDVDEDTVEEYYDEQECFEDYEYDDEYGDYL